MEGTAVAETTSEETNDRVEATAEETTVTAEAAVLAPIKLVPKPVNSVIGSQEEESTNASLEGATRDQAQTEEGISATQTAAPDPATVGSRLTFTVVVTNNSFPQHVGFKDFLPPSMTFVSATSSQGFCGPPHHCGNLFDCTLGTIPNGSSVSIEIVAIPTAPGATTNLVQAVGGFAPVQYASATVAVNPQPE